VSFRTLTLIEWREDVPLRDEALAAAADTPITYWLDDELVIGKIVKVERSRGSRSQKVWVTYELEKFSKGVLSLDVRFSDGAILHAAYVPAARAIRVVT